MLADKIIEKLKNRDAEIKNKWYDDEISDTMYIINGGAIQGALEGLVDGCLLCGAIFLVGALGSAICNTVKDKEDK